MSANLAASAAILRMEAANVKIEAEAVVIPAIPVGTPVQPAQWSEADKQAMTAHYRAKNRRTELRSAAKRMYSLADELEFGPKRRRR